jgi:bisphosphoglycerate-independent phosphoglycerate mutase (AlkP superfamily)
LSYYCRAAENTNAYYQANNNHSQIKKAQLWFYAHTSYVFIEVSENTGKNESAKLLSTGLKA